MTTFESTLNAVAGATARRAAAIAVLGAAAASPAMALVLYDDFSATSIAPARWYGEEGKQYGGVRAEAQRAIVSGQLRLSAKGFGDNVSDIGASTVRNSLLMTKTAATTMRATVTMRTASAVACAANTGSASVARARLLGFFFNAGTPQPGNLYNEVLALVQLYRASNSTDGSGVLRVSAYVGICSDDSCINTSQIGAVDMGTATVGTPVALQMSWDKTNNQFLFQRDNQTAVSIPYTVSDTNASTNPIKRLEINNSMAHCTAGRVSATGTADFDNVQTN